MRQVELESHKFLTVTDILEGLLEEGSLDDITINQLLNKPEGKEMREKIKKTVGGNVTKVRIQEAINGGINEGRFYKEDVIKSGASKPSRYLKLKKE